MDFWVFGAAAAAGYIAKYCQNLSRDGDHISGYKKSDISSCPIRRLTGRNRIAKCISTDRQVSNGRLSDMYEAAEAESVSTSGYDQNVGNFDSYEDCNVLSLSSLPPDVSVNGNLKENDDLYELSNILGDNSCKPFMSRVDSLNDSRRTRSILRTKQSYSNLLKPLTSMESCLMAQLYNEHLKMEEYVLSFLPSPSTAAMRPLLVTDGTQVISRAKGNSSGAWVQAGDHKLQNKQNVYGIPPLPKIVTMDPPKKITSKTGKGCIERLSVSHKMGSGKLLYSHDGSLDGMVSFCLGISIGIISSLMANRGEVDKLKDSLKQTENLVQDLQEELEMKDSLMVKELANENCESQGTLEGSFHNGTPKTLLPVQNVDILPSDNCKKPFNEKAEESSESMSKIEAELEAELERLGLNMNVSSSQRRLSDLVEVDPDFVADFAQGELRVDVVSEGALVQLESDQDVNGSPTTHSGNYAVSPRELCLCLHEVIQSRLEERVKELEMALENSQRKVQLMESEQKNVQRKFSSSELRNPSGKETSIMNVKRNLSSIELTCSSDDDCPNLSNSEPRCSSQKGSPITGVDCNSMAEPLVMNLAGEALDAYNEAYEELTKLNDSEEADSPSWDYKNNHEVGLSSFDLRMQWDLNGGLNGYSYLTEHKYRTSKELYASQLNTGNDSRIQELLHQYKSEDENSDCNDEMEKLLIKQIVEKTKKGSPVVLNAQKVLLSVEDENEHRKKQ